MGTATTARIFPRIPSRWSMKPLPCEPVGTHSLVVGYTSHYSPLGYRLLRRKRETERYNPYIERAMGRSYDGGSEGFLVKVAFLPEFGDPDVLTIAEAPMPRVGPNDVLIKVAAAGVNRADILQRRGLYPSPPDAPPWPGLEVAGVVKRVGKGVTGFAPGQRVCALVPGGGYAQYVSCAESLVLPTPEGVTDIEAAALPEAVCTVWSNLRVGGVPTARSILIHGGSGGVGTIAIQIAKAIGMHVIVTAGGAERAARCVEPGSGLGHRLSQHGLRRGGCEVRRGRHGPRLHRRRVPQTQYRGAQG